jgi:hypothetical protein
MVAIGSRLLTRALGKLRARAAPDEEWLVRGTDDSVPPYQLINRRYSPDALCYRLGQHGEDKRLKYVAAYLDLRGLAVLELGPAYGHHTVLLDKLGATRIVCVESRAENVAACEATKARYGLDSTTIVQQDLEQLCRGDVAAAYEPGFDLVFNAGLLYHLSDPVPALQWCRAQAPQLFLATHYYETDAPAYYPAGAFTALRYRESDAMSYREGGVVDPLSGMEPTSVWMTEAALVEALQKAGYGRVSVLGRDVHNGFPHLTILARD